MAAKDDRYNIDDIGWKIIEELQKNARISFKQLAENVNLSTTATVERVRNMEDAGIIEGYGARINPRKVGYSLSAILNFTMNYGNPTSAIEKIVAETTEIVSCWSITGTSDVIMEVNLPSLEFLSLILSNLTRHGKVTMNIVLPGRFKKLYVKRPREVPKELLEEQEFK
ncbi:MAG: Lrp/AsnC family transcriptional regulator [Synergistaceae bacterium]|nr:Lrp/AsnC family transcriptional regulator [Synergistaceae bacterium]